MTTLQAFQVEPQCAKPKLRPSSYRDPAHYVTVTIKTTTPGARLLYALDASPPTSSPSPHGTPIQKAIGYVTVSTTQSGTTLKAIAYKTGWVDFADRSWNLPPYTLSESAKALAKRKETSPAVSTVEAVLLSAKLCSFRRHLLHQTEGVFLPLPCIQAHSEALASNQWSYLRPMLGMSETAERNDSSS